MRGLVILLLASGLANADTFLVKSTDGGVTWTDIDPGPPHQSLEWLGVDPATSNLLALTRTSVPGSQLLVSTDRGQTWQARQHFTLSPPVSIRAAAAADALYLAHGDNYPPASVIIAKITEAGNVVERYPAQELTIEGPKPGADFFSPVLMDLAVDPSQSPVLYALVGNYNFDWFTFQALWRSVDGGRSWRRLAPPVNANCSEPQFRIDPSGSRMYLLCGSDIFNSTDGGDSWTRTAGPGRGRIWNLEIGPGNPGILYGVQSDLYGYPADDAVWKSTDGAETWQRVGAVPGVWRLQAHPANPSVIFASGSNGIHRSEDGGETWRALLAAQVEYPWLGIRVDARAPDALYGVVSGAPRIELRLHDRQTFLRNLVGEKQVAPGSLVSIHGRDLASETRVAGSTPLPASLGGASVLVNGIPAPLLFVSPDQINAQIPFGLTGAVAIEVRGADETVDRQALNLLPRGVVILRQNLSRQSAPLLFHASDSRPVTPDDPARRGETLTLFGVGMGELVPSIRAGELPSTPPPQLRDPPCVVFSLSAEPVWRQQSSADPVWAGAAPGMVGVYRLDFEIPASLSAASHTLSLTNRPHPRALSGCSVDFQGVPLDSVTVEVQ